MALVSAHEYGLRDGPAGHTAAETFEATLALRPDFVEFDLQRTADGVFVVLHDRAVAISGTARPVAQTSLAELQHAGVDALTYADALDLLRAPVRAHLDFKFAAPDESYAGADEDTWEVAATVLALDVLGPDRFVVTTLEERGVAAVRRWSRAVGRDDILVGLSLGRSRRGLPLHRQLLGRFAELFPARQVRACDANVIVANRWLARFGLARWTRRRGLLLLVWTVDEPRQLRRWLGDPRCWMVTTNRVAQAVDIRDDLAR